MAAVRERARRLVAALVPRTAKEILDVACGSGETAALIKEIEGD